MKTLTLASIVVILSSIACGSNPQYRKLKVLETKETIEQCSVTKHENTAIIICPDGTSATITPEEIIKEVEKPIVTEKVIKIKSDPIYLGYYCSRNVIKIGNKAYLISSGLIRLTKAWTRVSNTCKLKYDKGLIKVRG